MTKKLILIASLVIFCISANAGIAKEKKKPAANKNPMITSIEIKGNKTIGTEIITDKIFTRLGDTLSNEKIQADLNAIYAIGYFSDATVTFESSKSGTKVIFKVEENPYIEEIEIRGNTVYSTEEITSTMSLKEGEMLSFKMLQDDIKAIDEKYHMDGYSLEKIINVNTDRILNKIVIEIQEGVIENVIVKGNDTTKNYVIERELNLKKGDVFNEKTLGKDLRRIFNLGFFSDVAPNLDPGTSPGKVLLTLNIKETRTGSVNFGGGYGEREGWFGFTDLNMDNLLGTGQGMMIKGQFGQQVSTYQFRYYHPWILPTLLGDHTSFTFRRWYTVGKDIYQNERSGIYNGGDISFGKPITESFSTALTLGSENVTPTDTSTFDAYLSNTVGVSLSYDTRDVWMNPSTGAYHTFAIKQGWKHTNNILTLFSKYSFDFNQFFKVADKNTIAFHDGLGIGFGDVPVGESYWIGGANTVRGYSPYESHTGRRKWLTNLEYRLTFNETFQGVVFIDWGDAWDNGGPDPNNFLFGKGFGVRLNTPMGPIRLDYGIAGGRSFGEGITHFSIGQAF